MQTQLAVHLKRNEDGYEHQLQTTCQSPRHDMTRLNVTLLDEEL